MHAESTSKLPAAETWRPVRTIRWIRLFSHILLGLMVVGVVFPKVKPEQRSRFTGWWARKLLRILNVALSVAGLQPEATLRKLIIAANHVSWIDIFVVSSARASRFIAKSEIRDWPVAGWLCDKAGTIFIRRTRRSDTAKINQLIRDALHDGSTIAFFPEGTTTRGDKLLKFHTSLFESAVANEAILVPVAIKYRDVNGQFNDTAAFTGDLSFAESVGMIIRQRATVAEITFSDAVAAAGKTRRELAMIAEESIAKILDVPVPNISQRFNPNSAVASKDTPA